MSTRLENLRDRLREVEAPAALLQNAVDVGYLSGFTGSTAALLVTAGQALFITDARYEIQAARECPGLKRIIVRNSGALQEAVAEQVRSLGVAPVAVEGDYLTVTQFQQLQEKLPGVELRPLTDLVGPLRRVKDEEEVRAIRAACALADRAFEFALTLLKPGVQERDVAAELEFFMKKQGAQKEAFDTIVASGPRSALPHGRASARRLEPGDLITFDLGARLDGYCSDLTRTVVLGRADARQREVYHVVLDAQRTALDAIRAGADGKAVDAVARDLIAARGYGEAFGHGLGHGLGRTVHDHVALSPQAEVTLQAGMVLTVEPGVYLEGWGGVRIEDDVVVTGAGCELLTQAPKHLIEVPV